MTWHLTDSVDDFWSAAGAFLRSRPVENSLPLPLTDTLRHRDLHYAAAWGASSKVELRSRLFRLDTLTPPTPAPAGQARVAGADDVVLSTDLANPTSNALYQRLGYRPVEDRVVLAFSS